MRESPRGRLVVRDGRPTLDMGAGRSRPIAPSDLVEVEFGLWNMVSYPGQVFVRGQIQVRGGVPYLLTRDTRWEVKREPVRILTQVVDYEGP